jgi:hypothetical protein
MLVRHQSLESPIIVTYGSIFCQNGYEFQIVSLIALIIVRVVYRCNLDSSSTNTYVYVIL